MQSHSYTRVNSICVFIRFLAAKAADAKEPKQKRPYLATECHDSLEADKWRQQILREIGRKVMEIQNAGLGDHRCGKLSTIVSPMLFSAYTLLPVMHTSSGLV